MGKSKVNVDSMTAFLAEPTNLAKDMKRKESTTSRVEGKNITTTDEREGKHPKITTSTEKPLLKQSTLKLIESSSIPKQADVERKGGMLLWLGNQNGEFSVKGLCADAEQQMYGPPSWLVPPWVKRVVPPKVVMLV